MAHLLRLRATDLARVRFAISPMAETVASLLLLHDVPLRNELHDPWRRSVGAALRTTQFRSELDLLLRLVPAGRCVPDYLTPTPVTARPSVYRQIATVRRTDDAAIRADLLGAYGADRVPDVYQPWCERPVEPLLETATAAIGRYWEHAIAPHWTRLADVLESDLLYRARRLAESGLEGLLADLHPRVSLTGDGLRVGGVPGLAAESEAGGLVLIPSVFLWPRLVVGGAPGGPTVIVYPARGVGEVWSTRSAPVVGSLSRVLGECRARLLADLHQPRATDELSRRHGLSPATVSYHLGALRDGGLLERHRVGRRVLYRRSHLGDMLVWGADTGSPDAP
jgi:DNA-binding transcriptional ArsR family regulator